MLLHPLDVPACDLTFAYVLFKILKAKNVEYPELKDDRKELQVNQRIGKFLFLTECKRTLHVNSSQANSASNSSVHVEESTRPSPRTPPSIDKLAIQHQAKSNFHNDFQNEIIAPFNSKNNSKNKFSRDSSIQTQMPFVYENENRERGQHPFHLRPSADLQRRNIAEDMMQVNPIYGKYDNPLDLQINNQSSSQSRDQLSSRAFNRPFRNTEMSQFNRHRVIPLPCSRPKRGRPGDVPTYYSTPNSKFTGKFQMNTAFRDINAYSTSNDRLHG